MPPIPSPTDEPQSLVQSLWAIKQNIEVVQGTRGASRPNTGYVSEVSTAIDAAIAIVAAS